MRSLIITIIALWCFVSCEYDGKATEIVENGRVIGAYIRTTDVQNVVFPVNDTQSVFDVGLEIKDELNGRLFETIEVFLQFKDNTPENGQSTTIEELYKTLVPSSFKIGPFDLPQTRLSFSYQDALDFFDLPHNSVHCKDQFLVRLQINLPNGLSFTIGDSSSTIIAFDDFWSSPFGYTINIVEPVDDALFTGTYTLESILDGPLGPTFEFAGQDKVTIYKGHSTNVREMKLFHRLGDAHLGNRTYRFTIACDEIIMGKNLLSSKVGFCNQLPAILLGPGDENAPVNDQDDSVFELWFVEGYLGFDGNCGFGTAPSRYRFSKQ